MALRIVNVTELFLGPLNMVNIPTLDSSQMASSTIMSVAFVALLKFIISVTIPASFTRTYEVGIAHRSSACPRGSRKPVLGQSLMTIKYGHVAAWKGFQPLHSSLAVSSTSNKLQAVLYVLLLWNFNSNVISWIGFQWWWIWLRAETFLKPL